MGTRAIPEVDMINASRSLRQQRKAILGFAPNIGLSFVNYRSMELVDNFYLDCQNHRDYFRDPYDKLHRPPIFRYQQGSCGMKPDYNAEALVAPTKWVVERKPVVYPEQYSRHLNLDGSIRIGAYCASKSDNRFKR
ncbi:CG13110 [Drosophila busckii]|uniref:CG13110 n=1 Tax=Drosophila busckii TaxID=30019 RepID=A0A0M4EIB5_DROBS|nr:CG13110 [Drosophila busckii]